MSQVKDEHKHITWGDKLMVTTVGMWGHDAYTEEYAYAGTKGKYPDYEYRFSRCGDSSVYPDKYTDVHFDSKNFYEGFNNGAYKIKQIIKGNRDEQLRGGS